MRMFVSLLIVIFFFGVSCKKDLYYQGNPVLKFSTDTVSFDTVFTSLGTATLRLMVYNPYRDPVKILSVSLGKGIRSSFAINVNGAEGPEVKDVTIDGSDSLYVFVRAMVPPSGSGLPLLTDDSVLFRTASNTQSVKIVAYAQDVFLLKDTTLQSQTWHGPKPYLIDGNLLVDSLQTLTIDSGVVVYLHKLANIFVKGSLQVKGSYTAPVIFQHDRLEKLYSDIPGQWGGIYFLPGSMNNHLEHATIKNGTTGIGLGKPGDSQGAELVLSNVMVTQMSYAGLDAYMSKIYASNCLIANAGIYVCRIDGGSAQFYHSTLANYYSGREAGSSCLTLSNYRVDDNPATVIPLDLTATFFRNCIIYGSYNHEIDLQTDLQKGGTADYSFDHCLLRGDSIPGNSSSIIKVMYNKDPRFVSVENLKFQLDTLSPAKDSGFIDYGKLYPLDLDDHNRMQDGAPDLGAYERIEQPQ